MNTNISIHTASEPLAELLQAISPTPRVEILLAIGVGEACVCHLEALFGWRQAYLSQHLMALRKAGLLLDRREGRYIYYRLAKPGILHLLLQAAQLCGLSTTDIEQLSSPVIPTECECPHCVVQLIPMESVHPL